MSQPPPDLHTPRSTAPPPPEDPTLVNTLRQHGPGRLVFARFRLVRELGAGGMAVVWLAQDERLGLGVALKFLPGMVASDPEALHDLRREITRGLRLTHPGIVRVYDLHEDSSEGLAAIAMEYVDGPTLTDEKARQPGRCFDVAEPLISWTRELCSVLTYVHEKAKVVHRDLKPRNLMLTAEGELKVADFGIAATLCDSHSRVSQHPGSSGTPVYMSPQQAIGHKPSVADDVYAIGATLYELLTSKPPFFRGSMAVILNQVSTQTPPSIADRRAEFEITGRRAIPLEWEETIAACLAKDPAERPGSVREVAARLDAATTRTAPTAAAAVLPTLHSQPSPRVVRISEPRPHSPPSPPVQSPPVAPIRTPAPSVGPANQPAAPRRRLPLAITTVFALALPSAAFWWWGAEQPRRRHVREEAAQAVQRAADERGAEEKRAARLATEGAAAEKEAARVTAEKAAAEQQRLDDEKKRQAQMVADQQRADEVDRLAKQVAEAQEKITQMNAAAEAARTAHESARAAEPATPGRIVGKVLAVNPGWKFVVIDFGEKAGAQVDQQILATRAGKVIARLRITSIETSTAIADIVPSKGKSDPAVQPGDAVALSR